MSNINYLGGTNFIGSIKRLPETTFHLQRANIPGLNTTEIKVPSLLNAFKETYDEIIYNDLNWSFIVDEKLDNYMEISNWMHGLGFPQRFGQYKNLKDKKLIKSDISVIILNSSRNPVKEFVFVDAFPTTLSDLNLDSSSPSFQYIEANVVFAYDYYTINNLN